MTDRLELALAHHTWSRRIDELDDSALRAHVAAIRDSAGELGIWEKGGYIPLQPFTVGTNAYTAMHDASLQLQELLLKHALAACDGDLNRLADIAGLEESERWFLSSNRPLDEALGCRRSDVFVADGRPQFLEFNYGTCLNGGTAAPVLSTALLGSLTGRAVRQAHDVHTDSFFAARAAWVRAQLPASAPGVALLGLRSDGDEGSLKAFEAEADYFAEHGVPCDFVPVEEAEIADNTLVWNGKRYGIAIRYFMVTPKVQRDHFDFVVALEHATGTKLLGAYVSQLFTSKALLADLHSDQNLTSGQRALLDFVPWTARLHTGLVPRGDGRVDPVEWAEKNREKAILKPFNLFGSRGVLLGHLMSDAQWRSTLDEAVEDGRYVIQELVQPDAWTTRYWNSASEELVAVTSPVLLGPYMVDGRSGGCFAQQPLTGVAEDLLDSSRGRSYGVVMSAAT